MQLQLNKGNQAVQMTVLIMAPSPLSILFTTVFTLIRFCESEANPQTYLMPRRFNNLNLFSDIEFNTDAKNHTSALYNQPLSYQDHYNRAGSSGNFVFGHEKRGYKQVRIHQSSMHLEEVVEGIYAVTVARAASLLVDTTYSVLQLCGMLFK